MTEEIKIPVVWLKKLVELAKSLEHEIYWDEYYGKKDVDYNKVLKLVGYISSIENKLK